MLINLYHYVNTTLSIWCGSSLNLDISFELSEDHNFFVHETSKNIIHQCDKLNLESPKFYQVPKN